MTFSQSSRRPARASLLLAALISVGLLSACGKDADPNAKVAGTGAAAPAPTATAAPATPAAAKVNGTAISEAQINNILNRLGNPSPEQAKEAGKQVLGKLVDQEIVAQAATAQKLDQDPKFTQALEQARREMLANFYLEQLANKVVKPTDEEVKTYFDKNPALFADRRVYAMRELAIQAKPEFKAELEAALKREKSLEAVAKWLKDKKVPFTPNAIARPSEQIAPAILAQVRDIKDGTTILQEVPNGFMVVQKMESKPQPVSFDQAKAVVERMLLNQKRSEAAAKEVETLRSKAKVEYLGDYAQAAPAAAKPEDKASDKPTAPPADKAPAPAADAAKPAGK